MRKGRIVILLILVLVFIWGNSMLPAKTSAALSGWLHEILTGLLPQGVLASQGDGLLRKIAHFTEFAVLGCLLCWTFHPPGTRSRRFLIPALISGTLVAFVDEGIQLFTPGRGPRLTDVGIDFLGLLLGMGVFLMGCALTKHDD